MDFWLNLILVILISATTAFLSIAGGLILLSKKSLADKLQKYGPYIAVVVIIYAVFGDLVPEALEELDNITTLSLLLAGLAGGALLGFILGHFHHHNDVHGEHKHKIHGNDKSIKNKSQATSMIVVDSIHTIADGIMLGSTFAAGITAGIGAALSIVAHELPQEIGDFSIMLNSKMRRDRIIKLEAYVALILVPASVLTFIAGNIFAEQIPAVLAFSAGFLLYIAFGEITCIIGNIREKAPRQLK